MTLIWRKKVDLSVEQFYNKVSNYYEGGLTMSKKIIAIALMLVLALSAFNFSTLAANLVAKPTASTVLVNGKNISFDAYNINDNNYFKLRDLAYVLSGTETQFEVGWDGAANAISLTSGEPYTPVGGEMASKGSANKTPTPTSSKIYLDGKEVKFTAYNIDNNNYFKLRDIGLTFNFGVTWDGAKNTIVIDTSADYVPEATSASLTEPQARAIAQEWLDKHPMQEYKTLESEYDTTLVKDKEYYAFFLDSVEMYWFSILVNKESGELLSCVSSDGEDAPVETKPLDDYYKTYIEV